MLYSIIDSCKFDNHKIKIMKKYILPIFLLLISAVSAQDFQGKALYQSKFKLDVKLDSTRVSPAQQQQIIDMMKRQMEKSFELIFDKTTAIYQEEAKLEQEAGGFGGMMFIGGALNGKQFKDVKNKTYARESELMGKNFLIKDSLVTYHWKMVNETKMIGNYLCFKAEATVKGSEMAMNFGRNQRNQNETKDDKIEAKERELVVEAWYSPEVPVNNGPGDYWGLPGLIMEVTADRMSLQLVKLELNPKEKIQIKVPDKGKVVTKKEYDEIVAAKMEEMRQNFEGGRQKGSEGHRIQIRM